MNTATTTNPGKKSDDKKTATQNNVKTTPEVCTHTQEGKIVSFSGSRLVMTSPDGKECSHTVAADAKVTTDGIECKAGDLKAGARIRLTTKSDDKHIAIKLESLNKHVEFTKA